MLEILRKNNYVFEFAVTNADGTAKNLSAIAGGFYTLSDSNRSESAYIQKLFSDPEFTVSDAVAGIVQIELDAAEVETLPIGVAIYEELHLIDSGGEEKTVFTGELIATDTIAKGV